MSLDATSPQMEQQPPKRSIDPPHLQWSDLR